MRYDDDDEAISFFPFFSSFFLSVSFHKRGAAVYFLNFFKSHIYLFTKTIIQLVSLPNYRKASPPSGAMTVCIPPIIAEYSSASE